MARTSTYVRDKNSGEIQAYHPAHDEHPDRYVPCDPPDLRRGVAPQFRTTTVEGEGNENRKELSPNGKQENGGSAESAVKGAAKPTQRAKKESASKPTGEVKAIPKFTAPSTTKAADASSRRSTRSSKGT